MARRAASRAARNDDSAQQERPASELSKLKEALAEANRKLAQATPAAPAPSADPAANLSAAAADNESGAEKAKVQSALVRLQAMRDIPECVRDAFGEGGYQRQLQALEEELHAARSAARETKSLKEQLDGKQSFTKRMEKKAAAADATGLALQAKLVALNAQIEEHKGTTTKAHAEWETAKSELAALSAKYHAELTLGAATVAAPGRRQTIKLDANVANILQGLCRIVEPAQILQACGGDQQVADSLANQTAELLEEAAQQVSPPAAHVALQHEFEERLEALRKLEEEVMAVDSDDESLAPSEAGTEGVDAKSARRKVRSGKRREAFASFKTVASKFPKRAGGPAAGS
jgi:DNA repair exonuclease SbcCD ATPase subunit